MKTIGLIGGLSWESSAAYYRLLNEGVRGSDALKLANRAGQIGASLSTHAGEDSSHLQIGVLKRTVSKRRLRMSPVDRGTWAGLSRIRAGWKQALAIVQSATVIR